MLQLNLLPDVKLDYVKAQKNRRLVFTFSLVVTVIAVTIFVLIFAFDIFQKHHLSSLNNSINSEASTLKNEPNISKILTVQNQLESLTKLQTSKPAANNLFNYLNELTPTSDTITNLQVDFTKNTLVITGTANSLDSVNQYIDTLKLTSFSDSGSSNDQKAFSDIVLSSFGDTTPNSGGIGQSSGSNSSQQPASYTIDLSFSPELFDNTKDVTLSVPSITTTRLEELQPQNLFQAPLSNNGGSN